MHFYFLIFILCIGIFFLHVCMCTVSVPGAQGGQKKLLNALELQPQVSVSHVDARNQTLGLCKNTKCSKPRSSLSLSSP